MFKSTAYSNFVKYYPSQPQQLRQLATKEHDLFQQTVDIATGYILPDALAHQPPFKIEPIVQCLNKPLQDSYVETNDNSSNPVGGGNGTSSAASAGASGSSGSAASDSGKNGTMSTFSAPGSLGAAALALVSGAFAVLL